LKSSGYYKTKRTETRKEKSSQKTGSSPNMGRDSQRRVIIDDYGDRSLPFS
jgi:hypothetical protein